MKFILILMLGLIAVAFVEQASETTIIYLLASVPLIMAGLIGWAYFKMSWDLNEHDKN